MVKHLSDATVHRDKINLKSTPYGVYIEYLLQIPIFILVEFSELVEDQFSSLLDGSLLPRAQRVATSTRRTRCRGSGGLEGKPEISEVLRAIQGR